ALPRPLLGRVRRLLQRHSGHPHPGGLLPGPRRQRVVPGPHRPRRARRPPPRRPRLRAAHLRRQRGGLARPVRAAKPRPAARRPLAFRKVDKATWRVEAAGAGEVVARYRVYAHEVTVRASHLDASHAYWNGACLFLYADPHRARAARVTLADVPPGWRVSTG